MFKGNNQSRHYKMYKSGRAWVFASIVTAGMVVTFSGTQASADTTVDNDQATATVKPDPSAANTTATTTKLKTTASQATEPVTDQQEPQPKEAPAILPASTPAAAPTPVAKSSEPTIHTPEPSEQTPNSDSTPTPKLAKNRQTSRRTSRMAQLPAYSAPKVAVPTAAPVTAETIDQWMPNKKLQNLVANALGKNAASLTKDDLLKLTKLEVSHMNLATTTSNDGIHPYSLQGLEFATNLTYLDLSWNTYDMMMLGYDRGDITDISPLSALTKLTYLDLSSNHVNDVTPLANLTQLKTLNLNGNGIYDFSSLDYSQFTSLEFSEQQATLTTNYVVDPANPTITIPQLVKLPKNFSGKLSIDIPSDYNDNQILETIYQDHMNGGGLMRMYYRGGHIKTGEDGNPTTNADGSVTFLDLPDQISPSNYSVWPGYTAVQNPVKYYLIEDFSGSGEGKFITIRLFIPYVNPQPAEAITLHYQDSAGKAIKDDTTLPAGMIGDAYTIPAEDTVIDGYTLVQTIGETTGTYTDAPIDITFVYKKKATPPVVTPTTQSSVTVHYVDQQGQQLAADKVLTGDTGTPYQTAALNLSGYTLTTTPANASGTFGKTDSEVTYVYRANKTDETGNTGDTGNTTQPKKPSKPAKQPSPTTQLSAQDGGNAAGIISQQHGGNAAMLAGHATTPSTTGNAKVRAAVQDSVAWSTAAKRSQTTLPQTNERTSSPLIGIALLLSSLIGLGIWRKQD
ncbi:MucBP domain-containing protein [Levilactobacillus yonginensis]|uniref:MucBP domain-containing protein n=1 Tax=Levilactobacillus yonginensis TaxID=1054041 RepID=UPI00345E021A